MIITYHGEGCFKIQSGNFSLVLDPPSERFKADVILKTTSEEIKDPILRANPAEIATGGEYEVGGSRIKGFQLAEEGGLVKTAYVAEVEEMRLGFLGHASKVPSPETQEEFADVDILFAPLDDLTHNTGLSPEDAGKIVKQIEPHIVIPTHTKNPKEFLKELGKTAEPVQKLTLKKKELPTGLEVVWIRE